MTIGAIGTPLLASCEVDQMKLLFQTVLRGRANRVQVPSPPFRLRNAAPLPDPINYWITGHAAMRSFERFPVKPLALAAVAVAVGAGHVRDRSGPEIPAVMFAVTVHAGQPDLHVFVRYVGIKGLCRVAIRAVLIHRGASRMAGRAGGVVRIFRDRRIDREILAEMR